MIASGPRFEFTVVRPISELTGHLLVINCTCVQRSAVELGLTISPGGSSAVMRRGDPEGTMTFRVFVAAYGGEAELRP